MFRISQLFKKHNETPTENKMELLETKTTLSGKVVNLYQAGKSFKIEFNYPASKRVEAETIVKRFRNHERALKAFYK